MTEPFPNDVSIQRASFPKYPFTVSRRQNVYAVIPERVKTNEPALIKQLDPLKEIFH